MAETATETKTAPKATGGMAPVMKFFDMKPGEFRKAWEELSETDKEELKAGIADGSLNY